MTGERFFRFKRGGQGRRQSWRLLVVRLLIGPLIAMAVIVFLVASLLFDFRERQQDSNLQRQALLVMREATSVNTHATDMTTSLHGYLLTGNPSYLQDLENAREQALRRLARLEALLGARLAELEGALLQWHEEMNLSPAVPMVHDVERGSAAMAATAARLEEIIVEQQLLLAQVGSRPQAVELSLQVLITYKALMRNILEMEQGFFGFLLTGEAAALEPFLLGRLEYRRTLRLVEGLVGEAEQLERLEAINILVGRWLAEAAEPGIELRLEQASLSLDDLERGQDYIAGVRQLGLDFLEAENERYERRLTQAQASRRNEELRLLALSSLALVVLLLSSHYGVSKTLNHLSSLDKETERVAFFALHDALTGLPNRVLFRDRLEHELQRAKRNDSQAAVLFLDLDGFKEINDQAGHASGDQLLVAVARRLKHSTRQSDTVARLGGDEFAIILADVDGQHGAKVVAKALLEAVRQPFELKGQYYQVSTSIGISLYPEDTEDVEKLINNADRAMYAAKHSGKDNALLYSQLIRTSF